MVGQDRAHYQQRRNARINTFEHASPTLPGQFEHIEPLQRFTDLRAHHLDTAAQIYHKNIMVLFGHCVNKPFCRGGVGVEVLEVFWEELWLHFFCPTFWLHCILYRTYTGGEAPTISKIQNAM